MTRESRSVSNSEGQSHKTVSTATRTTFEVKGKPKQIRTQIPGSAYQPRLIARPNRLTSTATSWKKGAAGKPVTRSRLGCALLTPALRASFQFPAPSPRVPRSLKNNNLTYHSSWKSLGIDFCFCFCCCCQSFVVFSIHRLY